MGYLSLFVAGSPEPYDDDGNSPTLFNNNPLTSWDWLAETIKDEIMKRFVISIILALIATSYSFAQFSASVWYDGYWSEWHTVSPRYYKLFGNYSSMIIYSPEAHRSYYNFKFTINNYRTPSKDELKQYRKNNEWIQYNGTAEYYITDDYMTIKDIFKKLNFPSICPWKHQVDQGQTPCVKRIVNAVIKIQAYKDHPKRYEIIFDDVALCIDLESLYFKE